MWTTPDAGRDRSEGDRSEPCVRVGDKGRHVRTVNGGVKKPGTKTTSTASLTVEEVRKALASEVLKEDGPNLPVLSADVMRDLDRTHRIVRSANAIRRRRYSRDSRVFSEAPRRARRNSEPARVCGEGNQSTESPNCPRMLSPPFLQLTFDETQTQEPPN